MSGDQKSLWSISGWDSNWRQWWCYAVLASSQEAAIETARLLVVKPKWVRVIHAKPCDVMTDPFFAPLRNSHFFHRVN